MTQINSNLSATSLTSEQIKNEKEGSTLEEVKQPEMVSVWTSYDNTKDGTLSYQQDTSVQSAIDVQKNVQDKASELDENIAQKIAGKLDQLWSDAVGNINSKFSARIVAKNEEEFYQKSLDNDAKTSLQELANNTNSTVQKLYDNAIKEAQNQAKEEINYSKYDDNKDGSLSYQSDNTTKSFLDNAIDKTVDTRANGDSEAWDNIVMQQNGGTDFKSLVKEEMGNMSITYDINNTDDNDIESRLQVQADNAYRNVVQKYDLRIKQSDPKPTDDEKRADLSAEKEPEVVKSEDVAEKSMTLDELKSSGTKFKTKTREINGKKQEYVIYKDGQGNTVRQIVTDDGKLENIYQIQNNNAYKKAFISESFINQNLGENFDRSELGAWGSVRTDGKGNLTFLKSGGGVTYSADIKNAKELINDPTQKILEDAKKNGDKIDIADVDGEETSVMWRKEGDDKERKAYIINPDSKEVERAFIDYSRFDKKRGEYPLVSQTAVRQMAKNQTGIDYNTLKSKGIETVFENNTGKIHFIDQNGKKLLAFDVRRLFET